MGPKMPCVDIFGLEFENNIIMLETNTLNLSNCKISWKKQKCLNLGPKILLCVLIFVLEFENNIVIFGICVLLFVLLQSLVQKFLSLGLKVPDLIIFGLELEKLFVIFEISTSNLSDLVNFMKTWKCQNCPIWVSLDWNFEKLLSYLKSAPSNLSNFMNFEEKKTMSKFRTKNALFGYFWAKILKNY